MQDAPTIIAAKLANALIADAQPTAVAQAYSGGVLKLFKKGYGGLWVGGTITLTPRQLDFSPNALNQAVHENLQSTSIPLAQVIGVSDRFGILTRIIDVRLKDGSIFTFRCFGAKSLAQKIEAAVRACPGR